jgi:hypothetical protein
LLHLILEISFSSLQFNILRKPYADNVLRKGRGIREVKQARGGKTAEGSLVLLK